MTIQQHAEQARRIQEMIESLQQMQRAVWPAYPVRGRGRPRLEEAERALSRVRSELEDCFYRDHPDVAHRVGFPHYNRDALEQLEAMPGQTTERATS